MKTQFNVICDTAFVSIIVFIFFFAWIRFYTHSTFLSFCLSVAISALICTLFFKKYNKKVNKTKLTKLEKEQAALLALRLNFLDEAEVLSYFFNACTTHENPIKTEFGIIFGSNTKCLFTPIFSNAKLSLELFTKIVNFAQKQEINKIIICANVDKEIMSLSKQINIPCEFWDEYTLYKKKGRLLPPPICPIITPNLKPRKIEILKGVLQKARVKNYISFGLILLIFSIFIPMKLFYLTFGTLLLSFGVIVFIMNKKVIN